jgi:hypothetical protein
VAYGRNVGVQCHKNHLVLQGEGVSGIEKLEIKGGVLHEQ